ncbi:tyrosine-type recombinase/integrase [Pseudoalteromonas sp. SaAl2]
MKSKLFVAASGERLAILLEDDGLPLLYPNLFITALYRNGDQSSGSCKKAIEHIAYFYEISERLKINIERRCESGSFLSQQEIKNIAYYAGITQQAARAKLINETSAIPINCHKPQRLETARHVIRVEKQENMVFWQTKYNRLSVFGRYVNWLEKYHYPYGNSKSEEYFFDERPDKSEGYTYSEIHEQLGFKSLSKEQRSIFLDRVRPDYPNTPWTTEGVRYRNYALAMTLYVLGVRIGEALNIKLEDLIVRKGKNYLVIKRNAGDLDDPRIKQPKVKTNSRALALSPQLKSILDTYILDHRSYVQGSAYCSFLFISHRMRNNKTLPLSISGAEKVFRELENILGFKLNPHRLRHTWNDRYSESADKLIEHGKTTEEKSEADRCHLMGWAKGSTMSLVYSSRHDTKRAMEFALHLQDEDFELKESLAYDDDLLM